jgi:hypothetical protein
LEGSNQSGFKRRFASRQIKNAECFRIPKNPKIFVSVAVENGFLQNAGVRRRRYFTEFFEVKLKSADAGTLTTE